MCNICVVLAQPWLEHMVILHIKCIQINELKILDNPIQFSVHSKVLLVGKSPQKGKMRL